jgi:hypothetical protein
MFHASVRRRIGCHTDSSAGYQQQEVNSVQLLVTVRVNLSRMAEFGQRLRQGELDRSAIRMTYCLREDPAVGIGIWEATDEREFEKKFAPWREFYESAEVQPVVTPAEAMALLSQRGHNSTASI